MSSVSAWHSLLKGITVAAFRQQTEFRDCLTELNALWKAGQLRVLRNWDQSLPEASQSYTDLSCLLPSDVLWLNNHTPATPPLNSFKIATWNVNSVRVRMPLLLDWLSEKQPDVVCLQETKVEDGSFPVSELMSLGYTCHYYGQKLYNGVAILSKLPIDSVSYGFQSGYDPDNKRLIRASIAGIEILNVYIPQGQSTDSPKFPYKLEFLQQLSSEFQNSDLSQQKIVILGDFNVAPEALDLVDAQRMEGRVSFHPQEHKILNDWKDQGFLDVYRQLHPHQKEFSWWDFRTRGFERGEGMRIDHIWCSRAMSAQMVGCEIDLNPREQPRPSDHAPVMASFSL